MPSTTPTQPRRPRTLRFSLFSACVVIAATLPSGSRAARGAEPTATSAPAAKAAPIRAKLLRVRRIWDEAPHSAFTDLILWKGKLYCGFREGKGHAGDRGGLRIIVSTDGESWASAGLLRSDDYDLRDASLSVTPDDRIMVMGGAQAQRDGQRATGTFVAFSGDGETWTEPEIVLPLGRWLWRMNWHEGKAYGVSYATPDRKPWTTLHVTEDGRTIDTVVPELLSDGGWPTEARLRFAEDGTMYCLQRRDGPSGRTAYFGAAKPPYTDWSWHDTELRVGGPDFIRLPSGVWVGGGRLYDGGARTELLHVDVESAKLTPLLRLPSGGDTSYPGFVWHDGKLWMSYYSSHQEKTSIYLAEIEIEEIDLEAEARKANAPTEIGTRRELFVDETLVESLGGGARRRLHAPTPRESVLTLDRPWEGRYSAYFTVLRDEGEDGAPLYRMYYRGMPEAKHDFDHETTCYAESRDGIAWVKPELGLFEVHGTKANNVVLARHRACHNFTPFRDTRPGCPEDERYKAVGGTGRPGLVALVSADGIRWRDVQEEPIITQGAFDSQNVVFWSESEEQYVAYFRVFRRGVRWVARATSDDFVHWSYPVDLDFEDGPAEHLYTNQLTPYPRAPHIYVGSPTRFMPGRKVLTDAQTKALGTARGFDFRNDCADVCFVSTRGGGSAFDRSFLESWVRPGLDPKNWTSRANYTAYGFPQTSDTELSVYVNHNLGYTSAYVRRYTLRPDGFVSVRAGYEGGEVTTKLVVFRGGELRINYSTSAAGSVRVELLGSDGAPIPGFAIADCPEIVGDRLDQTVTWGGGADVSALAGTPVRLRFVLKDADIYAYRFLE